MRKRFAAALLAAFALTGTAQATTTFALTGGDGVNGTFGNARTFASGGINVRVSAWRATPNAGGFTWTVASSYLGRFGNGLGATSTGDNNGANNLHTIDNHDGVEFLLFQFDRNVRIAGATLNTYSVAGSSDNDAYVSTGMTALPWTSTINLATNAAITTALISNGMSIKNASGNPAVRSFAAYTQTGNIWLIGADFFNTDGADGFKLTNLIVTPAVPEPATWAMMLAGFGAVGAAVRRRRPTAALA
jgi:hypothetical protein